jgi:hypothetical protein
LHFIRYNINSIQRATIAGENMNAIKIKLTDKQRADLLISSKILKKDGSYNPRFFSGEIIAKTKVKKGR